MSWCIVPNPEWSWSNSTVAQCICRSGFPADNGDCEASGGTWHSGDGWGCETCLIDDTYSGYGGGGGGQDHWECNFMGGGGCVKSPTGTYGSQESCELDCPGGAPNVVASTGEGKYGDLSCGCDKYLMGQLSSLSMGPIMTELGPFPCQPVNENGATVYKCGVLGRSKIQKGKTYVVKISTAGGDKFDHSNHWWQVDFEKCEVKEETLETRIDAVIESSMLANGIPNAMFAMTINGSIAYSNYYSNTGVGGDNLEKEPVACGASIAKSICGAAIGTLYDSGKLSPDARLVDILSEHFYDSGGNRLFVDSRYETITVAHLADMQAGWNRDYAPDIPWGQDDVLFMDEYIAISLCNWFPDQYPDGIKLPIELKHIIQWENQRYLDFDPGTGGAAGWEGYSNYSYALLAEIIGRVSGKRYDAYVRSAILDPLGITMHFRGPDNKEGAGPDAHPDQWSLPTYPEISPVRSVWEGYCDSGGCFDQPTTVIPYYNRVNRYGFSMAMYRATDFAKFLTVFDYSPKSNAILSATAKDFMFSRKVWHGNEWEYYAYGQLTRDGVGEATHTGWLGSAEAVFFRWAGINPSAPCGPVNWVLLMNGRNFPSGNFQELMTPPLYSELESILQDPSVISPAFDISTDYALNDDCSPAPAPELPPEQTPGGGQEFWDCAYGFGGCLQTGGSGGGWATKAECIEQSICSY